MGRQKIKIVIEKLIKPFKFKLLKLQVIAFSAAFSEIANLALIGYFFKVFNTNRQSPAKYYLLLLIVVTSIFVFILRKTALSQQVKTTREVSTKVAEQVFVNTLNKDYLWHTNQNSSQSIGLITQDCDGASWSIQAFLNFNVNFTLSIVISIAISYISPILTISTLLSLLLAYALIIKRTNLSLYNSGLKISSGKREIIQVINESISSIKEIKLRRIESHIAKQFRESFDKYIFNYHHKYYLSTTPRYILEGFMLVLFVIFYALLDILDPTTDPMSVLAPFAIGAYRLLQPLQQCFTSISEMRSSQVALIRVLSRMDISNTIIELPRLHKYRKEERKEYSPLMELKDVSFQYKDNGRYILKSVNLTIESGDSIVIVGETGSGKSTLVDLIMGLIRPSEGTLKVDGANIHDSLTKVYSWQARIAYVPQLIHLNDATILENLTYSAGRDVTQDQINQVIDIAELRSMIDSSENGLMTRTGERGLKISGGQRQRISIARALLQDFDILVLDEATSALDIDTEKKIMRSIFDNFPNATIIQISHRPNSIMFGKKIFRVENQTVNCYSNELKQFSL